jgi:RNA polymerase sigma factor (sigma-70 family)
MHTDSELLRQYVSARCESAFAELVQRHVDLVYAAAVRELAGDTAQAEDLSQAVFLELARKGPRLLKHPTLAGWLYTSVRLVAANQRRADARRRLREQSSMNEWPVPDSPEAGWSQIRPWLDDAVHELSEKDRAAVALRFFEERSLKEISQNLGVSENAARMRVDRALDKLREGLARRGIHSTASGLAAALAVGAISPAPSTLAATIATATLAAAATPLSATLLIMTPLKIGLASALLVAGLATPVWQQNRVNRLIRENAALTEQAGQAEALRKEIAQLRQAPEHTKELTAARAEVAQLLAELAKLRGNSAEVMRKKAENTQLRTELAKKSAENGTNEVSEAMTEVMKNALKGQIQGRIDRMKEKLNLTADQEKAIGEILLAEAGQSTALAQKLMSGKPISRNDLTRPAKATRGSEAQIKDLLTPEQLGAYDGYKQEENTYTARLAAKSELFQLQSSLELTSAQESKIATLLYEQSLKQLNGETAQALLAAGGGSTNPTFETMEFALEQKLKALETVLTPEQLAKYRQQQAAQLKYIKSLSGLLPAKGN